MVTSSTTMLKRSSPNEFDVSTAAWEFIPFHFAISFSDADLHGPCFIVDATRGGAMDSGMQEWELFTAHCLSRIPVNQAGSCMFLSCRGIRAVINSESRVHSLLQLSGIHNLRFENFSRD